MHISYKEYRKKYPDGVLLSKPVKGDEGSPYKNYFADRDKLGIFGRTNDFHRLDGKDKVLGLNWGDYQIAVALDKLKQSEFVHLDKINPQVLIIYDQNSETALSYIIPEAELYQNKTITLVNNSIIIEGTDYKWNIYSGKSNSDKLPDLELAPVITSYWFAWISFFPKTELIK